MWPGVDQAFTIPVKAEEDTPVANSTVISMLV
jgi:hypothetical protein